MSSFNPGSGVAGVREIPGRILAASLRGNSEMPQVHGASVLRVGTLAMGMIAANQLSWGELVELDVTPEEIAHMGAAATAAHNKHGIAISFSPEAPSGYRIEDRGGRLARVRDPQLMRSAAVEGSVQQPIKIIRRTLIAYAAATLPTEFVEKNVEGEESDTPQQRGRLLVEEILTNPDHKPKLLAFAALFKHSQELLRTKTVLEEAEAYRKALGATYASNDTDGRNDARLDVEKLLYTRLSTELGKEEVRASIAQESGFDVPEDVVRSFARHISYFYIYQPSVTFKR